MMMAGGDERRGADRVDQARRARHAHLVYPAWSIRRPLLLTGLTRDGTFYIENGKIKYAIKNFRFNESPAIMLNNLEEIGKPVRVGDDESPFVMMIPPLKIRDFTFSSLSDAV